MSDEQTTDGAGAGAGDEETTDVNTGAPAGSAAGETDSAEPEKTGGAGTTPAEDEGVADDESDESDGSDDDDEASDEGEGGVAVATKSADRGGDPEEERLERLGEQIRHAAQTAEDAIGEPGQKFYESGSEESEESDDQTIAPPG